jgi:hypothetical protein
MIKHTRPALAIAAVLVGLALAVWWFQRPERTTQAFVGHLSNERYEEAALMLLEPSALELTSGGDLILTDAAGEVTAVPATKLPFLVAGGDEGGPDHDFKMMALGSSTEGVLDTPAVTLFLSVDGGRVPIEGVDS